MLSCLVDLHAMCAKPIVACALYAVVICSNKEVRLAVAGFSATATKIAVSFAAIFFSFRDVRWIEDKFTFMHGRIRG